MNTRKTIKLIIPPLILQLRQRLWIKNSIHYFGNYESFQAAKQNTDGGYADKGILDSVAGAMEQVREGNAAFERDGVLFHKMEYKTELLSALFYVCAKEGQLNLIDFGGALGSIYFQYRELFKGMRVHWTVVEQDEFVTYGQQYVPEIDFEHTIQETDGAKNAVLFSSVLQYIPNPYEVLETVARKEITYIVIDRIAFYEKERFVLQKVPDSVYKAVYPCRLFYEKDLIEKIQSLGYRMVYDWEDSYAPIPIKEGLCLRSTYNKGFLFERERS